MKALWRARYRQGVAANPPGGVSLPAARAGPVTLVVQGLLVVRGLPAVPEWLVVRRRVRRGAEVQARPALKVRERAERAPASLEVEVRPGRVRWVVAQAQEVEPVPALGLEQDQSRARE
ncbi:hypothetical protein ASH00_00650 [Arthrobacter sp. Soil782]|uniref:hypothetical protein n=1 Tax=Arthrobacter sp. Soil782 TaxID=1736410 RepID=UPI0006FE7FC3|nr:hypothetical protein [Arthrobacter sp. Soil782]KRF08280.1 hypothetical protein ASH00_00650 [Arthrobacter sp. Soil782]